MSYLVGVELQQDVHLQCGDMQRPAAKLQLSMTEPCPLQPPRLRVAQPIYGLTCRHMPCLTLS